jgi:transposase
MKHVDAARLVFLDESGANTSMMRSHAWIRRGDELVEPRPANWGINLTMIGAVRLDGWLTLSTFFKTANRERFVRWIRRRLVPKLRAGDIVVMDNAQAHHDLRVRTAIEACGAELEYLPPYSPDLNPIEPAWALTKQYIKKMAPRAPHTLRRAAHAGRRQVQERHCRGWFQRAGYCRTAN